MKKLISLAAVLLLTIFAFVQGDTTGRSDLAYLFQPLNANNIPIGFMMEWGTDMTDKDDLKNNLIIC